jgi:release factor glutamine methyltransferase
MTQDRWTIQEALNWTSGYLTRHDDAHGRLSAEWLLAAATGLSRIELYAYFDRPLSPEERARLRESVQRRATGEPLQYITGEVGFRHLTLKTRPGVLIPRPETEILVDLALEYVTSMRRGRVSRVPLSQAVATNGTRDTRPLHEPATSVGTDAHIRGHDNGDCADGCGQPSLHGQTHILDLCTGSGCIGLALAQELPQAQVYATDLAPEAVALARDNAAELGLSKRFTVASGDLFAAVDALPRSDFDVIVTNPPYVPSGDLAGLDREVADFEPRLALDGGADGLDVARRILQEAPRYLTADGGIFMELDARYLPQARQFAVELKRYQSVEVRADLTGRERFLVCLRKR